MTIQIRLATPHDAPAIHTIYAPIVRDTFISFEEVIPTPDDLAKRITNTLQQYPYLICEIDGQVAGYAYSSSFRSRVAYQWTTEVTVYVHPDYHRRGIGRAIYTSLFAILKQQGYLNLIGVIALPNAGSVGLHESLGFEEIGVLKNMGYKHKGWHDTGWWQLELRPMPTDPQPPTPITDLAQQDIFTSLINAGLPLIRV